MFRRPPRTSCTATLIPFTPLFRSRPRTLMRVRILDAATGMVMAGYEGAELRRHLGGPGATAETGVIAPGMRRVVYLGVPLTGAPGKLLHRIEFHAEGGEPVTLEAGDRKSTRLNSSH